VDDTNPVCDGWQRELWLIGMTLDEIKQAIEKLPDEEFFELARRLSARCPELCQEKAGRDEGRGHCDVVSGEKK
jgi:hypothetical protein